MNLLKVSVIFCFLIVHLAYGKKIAGRNRKKLNSKIPIVGDGEGYGSTNNKIELDKNSPIVEVYAILQNDSAVMNFDFFDYDECITTLGLKKSCKFDVNIGKDTLLLSLLVDKGVIGFKVNAKDPIRSYSGRTFDFKKSLKLVIYKNGEFALNDYTFTSELLLLKKLKPVMLKGGRQAVYVKFNVSGLQNSTVRLDFPSPPSCTVDFKIVEGIINTGMHTITKEIRTTTGTSTKSGRTEHHQDTYKHIKEKLNKHNVGVSYKAGLKLGKIFNIGTKASYNYERQDKDTEESFTLDDVTSFIEQSIHEEREVKISFMFPKKTSTIIKQLFMKCLDIQIETGVIMVDQVKLPDTNNLTTSNVTNDTTTDSNITVNGAILTDGLLFTITLFGVYYLAF